MSDKLKDKRIYELESAIKYALMIEAYWTPKEHVDLDETGINGALALMHIKFMNLVKDAPAKGE